jgi:acyl-[acyl-carrier-protein] desaturase
MVYTTIQELATRAFYQCTAEAIEHEAPELARALRRVARDETLHYTFYRDVVQAHLQAEPSYVIPLAEVMIRFQMPGYILDDFAERSAFLAERGVFGPDHFYRDVITVLWSYWGIDDAIARLGGEAEPVRKMLQYRNALRRLADRAAQRRATEERSKIAVE